MVEWEDGSITHKPLNIFGCDAPEICVEYGQKHNLLNKPGVETVSSYCQIKKEIQHKCCKVKSFHNTVQYMYGVCIPHDTKEALKHDDENSSDNWKRAI